MRQKQNRQHITKAASFLSLLAMLGSLLMPAWSAPSGGSVTNGNATINQSGNTTTINQSSNQAIIHWQQFNTNANEAVNFQQPSSSAITLNQIFQNSPSLLLGTLTANGHVWLLNSSGVVFGPGSTTNVGGVLASTLSMADSDFINGNYHLLQNSSMPYGAVVVDNGASINAKTATLIAPLVYVQNNGAVVGTGGRALLDGSTEEYVSLDPQGLIQIANVSHPNAAAGPVVMRTADVDKALTGLVNNTFIYPASTITQNANGTTTLSGVSGSAIVNGGVTTIGGSIPGSPSLVLTSDHETIVGPGSYVLASSGGTPAGGVLQVLSSGNIVEWQGNVVQLGHLGSLTMQAAGNLAITADSNVNELSGPGDLDILAGGDIAIGNASTVTQQGSTFADLNIKGGRNVAIDSSTVRQLNSENMNITAGGNLWINNDVIEHSIGQDTTIQAGGDAALGNSTIEADHDGNFSLTAAAIGMQNVVLTHSFAANTNITATDPGVGSFWATNDNITNSNTNGLFLRTAVDINLGNSTVINQHAGDMTLSAGNNMSLLDDVLTNNGGTTLVGAGQLALFANGGIGMSNTTITSSYATDVMVHTGNGLTLDKSSVSLDHGGSLHLLNDNGVLDLVYANIQNSNSNPSFAGNTIISSGGDLWLTTSTVNALSTVGDTVLNAGGNLILGWHSNVDMPGGGVLSLVANNGDILLSQGSIVAADHNLGMSMNANNGSITVNLGSAVGHSASPYTTLFAKNITFAGGNYNGTGVNAVNFDATNAINILSSSVNITDSPAVNLSAQNNVSLSQASFNFANSSLLIQATGKTIYSNSGNFNVNF